MERNDISLTVNYIKLIHPEIIAKRVIAAIIIISFFGIILAKSDPYNAEIYKLMLVIVVLIDSFGIYMLSSTEKKQKMFFLFLGLVYMGISILCLLVFYKYIYIGMRITNPVFISIAIGVYILLIPIVILIVKFMIKKGDFSINNKRKNTNVFAGSTIGLGVLGMFVARAMFNYIGEENKFFAIPMFFIVLGIVSEIGIHNFYKYYLIIRSKTKLSN
jgi:hypothetical protein